jgi:TonB-dependent SusC/RagA subfamily outer membrane receptor
VVVVGYGTQKRRDLTGAVSSVNAATIAKVPVTTLDQALQGRAAGVQIVNNDAAPGGNVSVLIRGIGSLASGGNTPLYVVDGYPTTAGMNNINPNDIASIDVLKDASATAIYGIRAANGVIIITTKKGTKNKMQVSLDASVSTQTKPEQYRPVKCTEAGQRFLMRLRLQIQPILIMVYQSGIHPRRFIVWIGRMLFIETA